MGSLGFMTAVDLLRSDAEYAFGEVLKSLEGLDEGHAWAVLPPAENDFLYTDGSVQGLVLHLATCKRAYASICFRDTELRWRDIAEEVEQFEPSWPAAQDYLSKSHRYWLESWVDLTDARLAEMRPTNWGSDRAAWKILQIMSQHDSYHAGQITVVRYATKVASDRPASLAEDIRRCCRGSVHW